MLKVLFKFILWGSLLFLFVMLWTVTFGQSVHFEFRDDKVASNYYNILFFGTPIAILLTLSGSLKKRYNISKKFLIIFTTIALTALTFIFLVNNLFTIGFGRWSTFNIVYEYKTNTERQIREDRYDVGALGYGSTRIVESKPFALLFLKVSPVDTNKIDKAEWRRVDKEADIRFP